MNTNKTYDDAVKEVFNYRLKLEEVYKKIKQENENSDTSNLTRVIGTVDNVLKILKGVTTTEKIISEYYK